MPAETNSRRIIIAAAIVLAAAAAFWLLMLSPKKKEASELATQVEAQQQVLTEAQTKAAEAGAARKAFPKDYRQMVLLGKAVPQGDETASLIVQLQTIANRSRVSFNELLLEGASESETTTGLAPEAGPTSDPKPVPPTEAEAALLPLGATVGTANLGAMPYKLVLVGTFSHLAHFIHGLERLVKTQNEKMVVKGRLLTLDGFGVATDDKAAFPRLAAEIKMTAYLAPPAQTGTEGVAEAAPPIEAEVPEAAPEAETTTASPSSYSTGEER